MGSQEEKTEDGELRARLRAARRKVRRLEKQLRGQRSELRQLRAQSLDVFPDLELSPTVQRVIQQVHEERLTFLRPDRLASLAKLVLEAEVTGRPGIVIEAGTALGGSAIAMAAAKEPTRPMRVYDVFATIPPPSEQDGEDAGQRYARIASGGAEGVDGDTYYGYREDLLGQVSAAFSRCGVPLADHNVELVEGLFEDTLVVDEPVALAHIDSDWYESTMTCLTRIAPHLVPGGRLVIDDYRIWEGCRRAVDEYFRDRPEFRVERRAKVHVVRRPD